MHEVHLRRSFAPWNHVRSFWELYNLIRSGAFDVVNTHGPVAAAVGRIAAWLGGRPKIVNTVHGFYFHDNMPALLRWPIMATEWLIGRITDGFMFVSEEDHCTARRTGIAPVRSRTTTLFNGVDLNLYAPAASPAETRDLKRRLGVEDGAPVIGIVGRIVREKGYREFLQMAQNVLQRHKAVFLVVGDTLPSDRDQFGNVFREQVKKAGLMPHFIFTGHTDRVADYLRVMDLFTLPSYREGFPVSVIEAMSIGLPVVTTDIRGCREAVVPGKTGLVVPPKDSAGLTDAIEYLLSHREEAKQMGQAGRRRAVSFYDDRAVQRRFVDFMDEACRKAGNPPVDSYQLESQT